MDRYGEDFETGRVRARFRVEEDDPEIDGVRQEPPVGELLRELVDSGQVLIREELRLAKLELRDEAKKAARTGVDFAAGGVLLHTAFVVIAFALVFALATLMPLWVSALLVGALLAAGGAYLANQGRLRAQKLRRVAPETTQTVKENAEWARKTMHAARSRMRENA